MRVLSIIGTRPEALKMGPVLRILAATRGVKSIVCATGQHLALFRDAFDLFGFKPDFNLALMRAGQTPDELTAALLLRLGPIIRRVRPDWILAVGDTTSVLGASLAAAHHRVRFAHVEAGLRTNFKWDPFPEEFNRRVATVLADLHFAPTAHARKNLLRENVPARHIVVTGNPIIDALRNFSRQSPSPASSSIFWRRLCLNSKGTIPSRLLVVTFHRRENIGRPIREICAALRQLARDYLGTIRILCIIHPNPEVREPTRLDLSGVPYIVLCKPLDYLTMIAVLKCAHLVLTDSGGLQEEAPYLGVPVLVLRNHTERPEAVAAGATRLVGTARRDIVAAARSLLDDPAAHRAMSQKFTGYGDGHAAKRIVQALQRHNH